MDYYGLLFYVFIIIVGIILVKVLLSISNYLKYEVMPCFCQQEVKSFIDLIAEILSAGGEIIY